MSGETDLEAMLATLTVSRRPDLYTLVNIGQVGGARLELGEGIEALISEAEGVTVVCTLDAARNNDWQFEFEAAWLTLDVHSSLEAVGLTAAFSKVLGEAGISCNVIAGFFHDHLLVSADRADDAVACLETLRQRSAGPAD